MPRNLESGEASSADSQDNIIPPVEEQKPNFLEGYRVHEKDEAKRAAERKELHTGEKGIVNDRTERVQAYLDRLENVFLNKDKAIRERNIALLKPLIHNNTIIKAENFPDSYFDFQKQQAKERGLGEVFFDEQEKKDEIERVQKNQRLSLDSWIDYLTSDDCKYPADVKYFAMQGVLKLGKFDTEKYSFAKRGKDTAAPFAEIDREALSTVLGALDAKHHKGDISGYSPKLLELIDGKKGFGDMYAEIMRDLDSKADRENLLPITDGEWKVFEKGSDPKALSEALAGKRSNLCIADIGAATRYLEAGSVEVFFSYNHTKQPTVPRIAVAFNEQGVYEVRGTFNKSEDIDPQMSETNTLSKRIKDLPGGEAFMKKDADMKKMTALERKHKEAQKNYYGGQSRLDTEIPELTKDELRFIYEIDRPIEGFGYKRDPRIIDLLMARDKRDNKAKDLAFIFDCKPEEVYTKGGFPISQEILEEMKVYSGNFVPYRNTTSLGNIRVIVGGLYLRLSKIKSLGKLELITGGADFGESGLEDLGQLKIVCGRLLVDEPSKLDFKNIEVRNFVYGDDFDPDDFDNIQTFADYFDPNYH